VGLGFVRCFPFIEGREVGVGAYQKLLINRWLSSNIMLTRSFEHYELVHRVATHGMPYHPQETR
jgi:hypothetical protein